MLGETPRLRRAHIANVRDSTISRLNTKRDSGPIIGGTRGSAPSLKFLNNIRMGHRQRVPNGGNPNEDNTAGRPLPSPSLDSQSFRGVNISRRILKPFFPEFAISTAYASQPDEAPHKLSTTVAIS